MRHFFSSQGTHPANLLNSPFVINTWQGHFKFICAWFCFFPPRMRRAFLPLRVYVSLFHWHWFLCHTAQLLSKAQNLSSLYIATGVHFLYEFPGIVSLFFLRNKGSRQYSGLSHNLFQDDIWPRRFAFWLTSFPCERTLISPVDCKGHNWIDENSDSGHPGSTEHFSFGNRCLFIFTIICKYSLSSLGEEDDENIKQGRGQPVLNIWHQCLLGFWDKSGTEETNEKRSSMCQVSQSPETGKQMRRKKIWVQSM